MGSKEGCVIPASESVPNLLTVGNNWRIAQMQDTNHISFSAKQLDGDSGNAAKTAMVYRSDGTQHSWITGEYNAFGDVPTFSDTAPMFGNKALQIDQWRIRVIDDRHMSISHSNGNVARIYRSDGTVHGNNKDFSGWKSDLGEPTCAFLTNKFIQLGDWRIGEYDETHLSVGHHNGYTSAIYRRDGTFHAGRGRRQDLNPWDFVVDDDDVLQGSTEGCAAIMDATLTPPDEGIEAKVLVKFNTRMSTLAANKDLYRVYNSPTSELEISSASLQRMVQPLNSL